MGIDVNIIFTPEGDPIAPDVISQKIVNFGYQDAVITVIHDSKYLDRNGEMFIQCATLILSNFGMTRSGPFYGNENQLKLLRSIWNEIGNSLFTIRNSIFESGLSSDRFLLELDHRKREELINQIWILSKQLLPFTMGKTSYGLVGASKILFSVLPEIVLPIDNIQWRCVFKTVDLGDVLNRMVSDIQRWEKATDRLFNELDPSKGLTTLPSAYNVMAMAARPKNIG